MDYRRHNNLNITTFSAVAFASAFVLFVFLFFGNVASAAFNPQINYQGKLTDSANQTVANGEYHMTFRLYTSPTGATTTNIWEEERTATGDLITVTSGLFSVLLGSTTPLTNVDFNQDLYLGVEIGGSAGSPAWDGEMTPRKRLGAVPAAFVAEVADSALTLDGIASSSFTRLGYNNSTSTVGSAFTITQTGAGSIFDLISGSTNVFSVLANGRVGIGTANPFNTLHVYGNSSYSGNAQYLSDASMGTSLYAFASKGYVDYQDNAKILNGNLTHIDFDDQGDNAIGVWGDGKFIYLANFGGGLHTYSVDSSGTLTHIDSDDQGGSAEGVWGDGKFIYLANSGGGLHTYSVDSSGTLTHIDSDDQGDFASGVWGDGKFIYLANNTGGLHTYSVDSSGNLTHIDSDDQGDVAYGVWGDGKFIYLANYAGGLHTYSVDSSGTLTHIDSDIQGDFAESVWGDGKFIYLANGAGGLRTYSVDSSGTLTHIDFDDQGGAARGVWGDGKFIYLANGTGGLHTYSVDSSGNLTHIDSDDQGDDAFGVWGDGKFIYLANFGGGLHTYSVDSAYEFDKANQEHYFSGNVGIGTTSPYAKLSVNGDVVAAYFVATSSTSTFAGVTTTGLAVTGAGTSTFANGINATAGCFAVNGTCVAGSGISTASGSDGYIQFKEGSSFASDASFFWDNTNKRLGIGTTSPFAKLSIQSTGGTAPLFAIASSTNGAGTTTSFIVSANGRVGVGTNNPSMLFEVGTGGTPGYTSGNDAFFNEDVEVEGVLYATRIQASSNDSNALVIKNASGDDRLTVTGSTGQLTFTTGGGINMGQGRITGLHAGSDSSPSIQQHADGNTGIYFPASDMLGFVTSGAEALRVTTTGLIGIGDTTPDGMLEVSASGGASDLLLLSSNDGNDGDLLVVKNGGNVGIGTTSPYAKLSVNGQVVGAYFVATSSTSTFAGVTTTGLAVTGAGTSTFANGIDLATGCFAVNGTCISGGGGGGSPGGSEGYIQFNESSAFAGDASFFWDNTNKRLGIGTTSPYAKLSIQSTGGTDPLFAIASSTNGAGTTTSFIVSANGRVGVGTNNPSMLFEVGTGGTPGYTSGNDAFFNEDVEVEGVLYATRIQASSNDSNALVIKNASGDDRLTVTGSTGQLTFTTGGGINMGQGRITGLHAGSDSSPSIQQHADGNTGIYFPASDMLGFVTSGAEALRVTTTGLIGIGDTTPDGMLEVSASGGASDLLLLSSNDGNDGDLLVVKNGGNVGIGTTSPYAKLSVNGQVVGAYFVATSSTSTFAGVTTTGLAVTGAGTSTFANGIDLATGCFAVNGTCISGGGGGGSPGGSDGEVQFKSGSSFAGDANFFWDNSTKRLGLGGTSTPAKTLSVVGEIYATATSTASTTNVLSINDGYKVAGVRVLWGSNDGASWYVGGAGSFASNSASENTGLGTGALLGNDGSSNTGIGYYALGDLALSGTYNTALGVNALYVNTTGGSNVAIGPLSLLSNATGNANVAVGLQALADNVSAASSTALGSFAGNQALDGQNIFLGYRAGENLQFGTQNIFLGYDIDSFTTDATSTLNIGNLIFGTGVDGTGTTYSTGNIGIGTSTPFAKLSVEGQLGASYGTFTATNSTTTIAGGLNVGNGSLVYDFSRGVTSFSSVELGNLNFDTDAGVVSWVDLPVSSNAGTSSQSYSAQIDGHSILTVYAQASTSGSIQNTGVMIGTSTASILNSANIPWGSLLVGNGILCVDDGSEDCDNTARTPGNIYAQGASVTGIDVAENYPTRDTDLLPGMLVMLDPHTDVYVTKFDFATTSTSTKTLLGIVSTKPGITLGGFATDETDAEVPIALTGRVPVLVTDEGGEIAAGDRITFSTTTAGYGTKALTSGYTVGFALESWSATTSTSSLLVFIEREKSFLDSEFVFENGNFGIGTTSPQYRLTVGGDVGATAFVNISTRDAKKDIAYINEQRKESMLTKLKGLQVAEYKYTFEENNDPLRLGLIAEEVPAEILSANGKGVDIYKFSTFILSGVQVLTGKVDDLEERIATLEAEFRLAQAKGGFVENITNGIANIASAVIGRLTVGTPEAPTGITLYDEVTGEPYCFKVSNGSPTTTPGECSGAPSANAGNTSGSESGADLEPPTFTINGNNPAYVEKGSTYNDLGVLVDDNTSNNLGYQTLGDDIDTSLLGTSTVYYVATDSAGNTATTTRTVVVFDPNEEVTEEEANDEGSEGASGEESGEENTEEGTEGNTEEENSEAEEEGAVEEGGNESENTLDDQSSTSGEGDTQEGDSEQGVTEEDESNQGNEGEQGVVEEEITEPEE
ncbi:MAG: immunoglobulin-like domain-containing protein [Candidatus Paceibacterota bacterium]